MSADSSESVEVLTSAVSVARFAPSVHNTQPWRWEITMGALELFADTRRQLRLSDPDGRLLTFSCGAALHHARKALEAQGYPNPAVSRARGRTVTSADPLARIALGERGESTEEGIQALRLMMYRHTDRWPVLDEPVPTETLERLSDTAESEGAHFHVLSDADVMTLSAITNEAQRIISADAKRLDEINEWSGASRSGVGVPEEAVNPEPGHVRVAPRRFGRARPTHPSDVTDEPDNDNSAVYGVVFATSDDVPAWLRSGEALSALWLVATELGLSVEPFSEPIEVDATRERLAGLLSGIGYPMLVLRIGWAHSPGFTPPATPRLSLEEILHRAGEDG
ncbi:Acg family FMN-binding oxidoreductase [Stackebrandtia soli]|uniref:Acg family FMN-binding oxidoreductase n=1 Tax=Stackebrandtia soli TaxID=1892856 RepID=UPI0039EBA6F4